MINLYAARFKKVLLEADEDMNTGLERDAMEASLDDGTDPSAFDPSNDMDSTQSELADVLSRRNQQIVGDLQSWIDSIDNFLKVLNSEDPTSIQSRLANAEPDTVFDKMKQSQQTKISRVASDLAALHQGFLGFMAQTKNAKYKYVAWALFSSLSFFGVDTSGFC
jgi:hypothetical protein